MKLTKKIPKNRAFDVDSPKATQDFKLSIFVCITLHDRKWLQMEGIAKKYGKWHTIYMKFNRWSKNGTIQRIFEEMQKLDIINVRTDTLCIDSTSIKVHLDAAGARKSNGEQIETIYSEDDHDLEPMKITKTVL